MTINLGFKRSARVPVLAWFLLFFSFSVGVLVFLQEPNFYSSISVRTPQGVSLLFVGQAKDNKSVCENILNSIERAHLKSCPDCVVDEKKCVTSLSDLEASYFSEASVDFPVLYLNNGVMVFQGGGEGVALAACELTESTLHQSEGNGRAVCFPSGAKRPMFKMPAAKVDFKHFAFGVLALLLAQLVSKFVTYLVIRYEHLHAHFSHDYSHAGPQKFHVLPTPRVGGVPIMAGLLVASVLLQTLPNQFSDSLFGLLLLASLPAFLGGLTEDITKKVGVAHRLILTMLSGFFASLLLGATISRGDFYFLDVILSFYPFAIIFTAFAVGGVANAMNIIDGYNGLASGFGILASGTLALIAGMHGDSFLLYANLTMAGALIGFWVWNWPGGKIFLGDGGAYLLGFWLAEMNILLLVRNPDVSVWFSFLVMIYPVFETLFTIYRRKFLHETHPGLPDANHLHQMIYKRLVRRYVGSKVVQQKIWRNSRVAIYVWGFSGFFMFMGVIFESNPLVLLCLCLVFCFIYVFLYKMMMGWRIPGFMRIKSGQ